MTFFTILAASRASIKSSMKDKCIGLRSSLDNISVRALEFRDSTSSALYFSKYPVVA